MAHAIVMPSFGMFTAEGRLTSWLVPSGTHVEAGQPVLEIETDKAVQEVIAPASGILHVVAVTGASVKEEQLLGYVLAEGETPSPPEEHREVEGRPRAETRKPSPDSPGLDEAPSGVALGVASGAVSGVASGPVLCRVVATPEARRLAAEHGIDLSCVTGTGPRGRIVAADVTACFQQP